MVERDGRLHLSGTEQTPAAEEALPRSIPRDRMQRIVAIDTESVVRLTMRAPHTEKHIYQLGAVRFGSDQQWIRERREFDEYIELEARDEELLQNDSVRQRYLARKRQRADVLEAFRGFIAGADAIVAYNGVAHDFVLLDEECVRAEQPPLAGPARVDGLYLAHALWPVPPRHHQLRDLFEHLRLGVEEFTWHQALDDARMLAILLTHGARSFRERDEGLRQLIRAVAHGSDAWELLFALPPSVAPARAFSEGEAGAVMSAALAARPPRRPISRPDEPPPQPATVSIPESLWQDGAPGTIDVHRLAAAAAAVKGGEAEQRREQDQMARQMRAWVREGRSALVEAPTGTGKTYPMLGAAIEWLAARSDHRVIISTFTKQLQLQLAKDIEALDVKALPGLVGVSDMVKGTSNRLSLRAIVLALAELSSTDRRRRRRGRPDYSDDPAFRELVIYLALRAIAQGTPTEEWESRSVDPVDVPAFFEDYCRGQRDLYLLSLSQARSGELEASSGELAQHADTVEEALHNHRLIIANHALLLANREALERFGPQTLLFVDEAHTLEGAATSALSRAIASTDFEHLVTDVASWRADQSGEFRAIDEVLDEFERFLDLEVIQRAAIHAFDAAERRLPGQDYPRRIVVASPFSGEARARQMSAFAYALRRAGVFVARLRGALRSIPPRADAYEKERLMMLRARVAALDEGLSAILIDFHILATPAVALAVPMTNVDRQHVETEEAHDEEAEEDPSGLPTEGEGAAPEQQMLPPPVAPAPNRVVWAEELLGAGVATRARAYRFRVTSSPIELGREPEYQRFTRMFARTYYVSATLRVAGAWDFMLGRLGLAGKVETIALPSPFNAAEQARLVSFSDFPSWAEETERAVKTVAHQVSGFARAMTDGAENGAMVLTTAKATASGIADRLNQMRAATGESYQVLATELLGNQRAIETFKKHGGVLVGTKGLWQGVDIAEPTRLRLVLVNKLPFAPFADPIIATRRALVRERAEAAGAEDPDTVANESYYLPLAAIELRQAVGRLIRTKQHRGVIVITDRKLSGSARLNRLYRDVFLGSLDPGMAVPDAETGEAWGGNVVPTREGWRRIWDFFAQSGLLSAERAAVLMTDDALDVQSELPETRLIKREALTVEALAALRAQGDQTLREDFLARCARIGGYLMPESAPAPIKLKDKQVDALAAIIAGKDLLAVLPTGYGKSFCFQLPALALPGVTIVVSPLVALMTDQALSLNRSIGGAVRALVAPMRESNSRTGKSEIQRQLTDPNADMGIKLVYLSPERLCQRQFQDWIRRGVELGLVGRIAIDEAHTFVQWGDDFRPSFRRAERFLRDIKRSSPKLQLLAFTATANETVREGLLRAIFGIEQGAPEPPNFAFVRANPIRTDLAIYRRSFGIGRAGHVRVAGLLERVVDSLDQHAIFYCLTIKEVEAHYAHLRDYLGDERDRVRRYHGRMSSVERAAVANDFREAPRYGDEGFKPMIVIATSAFGLGIDRPDIRCVFAVSPPTDLAALYQQLGRAGRDHEGGAGLALATASSFRTILFMTKRGPDEQLLLRAASLILASNALVDLRDVARQLLAEDLTSHRITPDEAARSQTEDRYHIAVVRVLAELAAADLVDDLGDFPMAVSIRAGALTADTPTTREFIESVLTAVGGAKQATLPHLYAALATRYGNEFGDHGGLWSELQRYHTSGYLDVSQAPNIDRGYYTALRVRSQNIPDRFAAGLGRHAQRVSVEIERLGRFFNESGTCANELIGNYFAVTDLPEGTCATATCRCSACWSDPARIAPGDREPTLLDALKTQTLTPHESTTARRRRDLDRHVERLLWLNYYGLGESFVHKVLRGEEMFRSHGALRPLPASLMNSNLWNVRPGLPLAELQASLGRLGAQGVIAADRGRWRLARNVQAVAPAKA